MEIRTRQPGEQRRGTRGSPIKVPIELTQPSPAPIQLRTLLDYDGFPTQFYLVSFPRRAQLRVDRGGDDPYRAHIQVSVLPRAGREPLWVMRNASGAGEWLTLPEGDYLIACALGIPERVQLELTLQARPHWQLAEAMVASGEGTALATPRGSSALAIAEGTAPSIATRAAGSALVAGGESLPLAVPHTAYGTSEAVAAGTSEAVADAAEVAWFDAYGREMITGAVLDPQLLDMQLVRSTDWETALVFTEQGSGNPRDLTGLTFHAEVWDLNRFERYLECSVTVETPALGGPVRVFISAAESEALPDRVMFDIRAEDGEGGLVYLFHAPQRVLQDYTL